MKNYNAKNFICGLLIGAIAITALFAVVRTKSTKYNGERNTSEQSSDSQTKVTNSAYVNNVAKVPSENTAKNEVPTTTYGDEAGKVSLQNETDKKALDTMQKTGNWSYVEPLFSTMTPEGVQEVVNLYIEKTGNYKQAEAALPYINGANFDKNVSAEPKTKSDYDLLASKAIVKTGDIHSVLIYISHMSTDKVDKMVKEYIDKTNDFNCSYAIRQYMSKNGIDDIVQSYIERTGDYGTVAAMLQFMSGDASKYVAKKYVNEAKEQQYSKFFTPYLQG